MKHFGICAIVISALALTAAPQLRGDDDDIPPAKLKAAKCPLCTKPVVPDCRTEYRDCSLFFCSDTCKGEFDEDNDKQCERANEQLVVTGQYEPIEELPPARLKTAKCPICSNGVSPTTSVAYNGCPLYFCGDECSETFVKTPTRYIPQANSQLFCTQQFKQSACPLCSKPIDLKQTCKVGGADVAFCGSACRTKAQKLPPPEAVATVYSKTSFTKNFRKVVKVS